MFIANILWIIAVVFRELFEEKDQVEASHPILGGERAVWHILRTIREIQLAVEFGIIVEEQFILPIQQEIEVFIHQQEIEIDLLFELGNIVNDYIWNP